jgi:hypothetical protein
MLKNNKHIFYNYCHCILQTRPTCILCGDTIYKCNKFISVEENGNYYIFYMRVQTIHVTNYTRYAVLRFDEGCVSTRTTEQTMLKVLGAMLRYIQQNKSSEDIFEIFLKEGYYVDKCVFKFLDLCRSVRLRLDPVIDGAM